MSTPSLQSGDALVVVDVQNDFCPGGRLPVPEGHQVVEVINRWIPAALDAGVPVVASRDWHPNDHVSFVSQGGEWPPHCIQDSPGAAFRDDLKLPDETIKVSKGARLDRDQYSAFDDTGLGDFLRKRGVRRVYVAGLALDVCVRATALSAAEEGFEVVLVADGTRAIDADNGRRTLEDVRRAGGRVAESS